jgi:hypothetical protein
MSTLYTDWLDAKAREAEAIAHRRALEDAIVKELGSPDFGEKVHTYESGKFVLKVTGRIDRKVDSEALQEIAREHGLTEHLSSLFRWKPEINMSAWKAADMSITEPLRDAITAKSGRPSFSIKVKEV